jgi:hypothetical protein
VRQPDGALGLSFQIKEVRKFERRSGTPNSRGDVRTRSDDANNDDASNDDASGDRRVLLARLVSWPEPFQRMRGLGAVLSFFSS